MYRVYKHAGHRSFYIEVEDDATAWNYNETWDAYTVDANGGIARFDFSYFIPSCNLVESHFFEMMVLTGVTEDQLLRYIEECKRQDA